MTLRHRGEILAPSLLLKIMNFEEKNGLRTYNFGTKHVSE